jgi:hypothetical protein
MRHSVKSFALLALLCGALAVLVPGPALAATSAQSDAVPCWKQVLNDWYDGTITGTYKTACYTSAIKHLPADVAIYSSAKDDIRNAQLAAERHQAAPPETPTTITTTTTTGGQVIVTTTTTSGPTTPSSSGTTTPPKTGITKFLDKLTPGNPDSFPLPLLILGALAILLIAAGGVGMLWQRSHPRTDPPAPA